MTKRFFDFSETYIQYTLCIYLLPKLSKNVQANFLMGLIFWKCWRVALKKFKFCMGIWIFLKKGFKSNGFHVVVWSQNLRFFLFRISSQIWRFSQIFRFSHFSFGLIFKRISSQKRLVLHVLCPSHSCASLARTVLKPLSFLAGTLQPLAILRYRPPSCE